MQTPEEWTTRLLGPIKNGNEGHQTSLGGETAPPRPHFQMWAAPFVYVVKWALVAHHKTQGLSLLQSSPPLDYDARGGSKVRRLYLHRSFADSQG